MGKAYYYFTATLPELEYQGKLPFTVEEFLDSAERLLDSEDYKLLDALLQDKNISTNNRILDAYKEYNRNLRNGWAIHRARKANKDPHDHVRGDYFEDPQIHTLLQEAEKGGDPLDVDHILSKAQWQFLSDLSAGQYFNLEYIIIYAVKLKMLQRYHLIQSPKGKEIYEELKKIEFPESIASGTPE